ncbi:hypothetical protein EV424DRAFT_74382 [Suillus variegatus]|nr:hypothetical protein EV424DRAFT_74382 [Suillus variegatus]
MLWPAASCCVRGVTTNVRATFLAVIRLLCHRTGACLLESERSDDSILLVPWARPCKRHPIQLRRPTCNPAEDECQWQDSDCCNGNDACDDAVRVPTDEPPPI